MRRLQANIFGNREFLGLLRNQGTFFCREENRELDLLLVDYDGIDCNVFEVTEEFSIHNGVHGSREDVVFLVNGIPVLVIECKNADKEEVVAVGVDQIRRYHEETPELFVPEMLFTATEAIGFAYGVTWNTVRRNIFNWKREEAGGLEGKFKSFCDRRHVLDLLAHYIVFAEKDDELNKIVLAQHQTGAVKRVVERCLENGCTRGLVWHTQGSGKTFTMIKAAERALQGAGGREAHHPAHDRPKRAGGADAQEPCGPGPAQRGAREPDQEAGQAPQG